MAVTIAVYAGWIGLAQPLRLGWLHARRGAGREIFEFEFDAVALAHPHALNLYLDPRLGLFEGRQHPPQGHENFGVFADASPDRWGRLLMRRRWERAQRAGHRVTKKRADEIVERSQAVVKQWPKVANHLHIRVREQERMASAFGLAG